MMFVWQAVFDSLLGPRELSPEGIQQMRELGDLLRIRYEGFLPYAYDHTQVESF